MSWKIEGLVEKAIEDGVIPGAVLFAQDKSGKLNYAKALGQSSLDPSAPKPMQLDTVFTLASMTKLLTTIAVLQLVDRGLVTLDTDVAPHLPALAAQPVLISEGDGDSKSFTTIPRTRPITVRHLLTHSSGCGYQFLDPRLGSFLAAKGVTGPPPTSSVEARFDYPLLFEPGTGWAYGSSIDWAGKLVEVLTGSSLDAHLQEHVVDALGLPARSLTLFPERSAEVSGRMAALTARDKDTGRVAHAPLPAPATDPGRASLGGEGGFADLSAYVRVLRSLLDDDGVLLSPATAALLFEPQIEPGAKRALLENVKNPYWIVGWVPETGEYDWSAGGLLVDGDSHAHRKNGFLFWAGVFNLNWFIDRTSGVISVFGTQVLTPADPLIRPLMKAFEEEIYSKL